MNKLIRVPDQNEGASSLIKVLHYRTSFCYVSQFIALKMLLLRSRTKFFKDQLKAGKVAYIKMVPVEHI